MTLHSIHLRAEEGKQPSMPLVFRENLGQWDNDILFKGSSSASNIFFTKKGMLVAHTRKLNSVQPWREEELENLYWKINFLGASENVQVSSAAAAESYTNYLVGPSEKHRTNIRDYNELRYQSIYKGIDLHYYSYNGELKYDFILSPNARMEDIRLNCEGVKNIRINKNGELEILHKWGSVLEKKPYSYQEVDGKKVEVDIRYEIKEKNTYGYKLYGKCDPSRKIIIDPLSIIWGTYVGGNNTTVSGYQYDIAVDAQGNTYGTGYYPGSFPTSSGAYDQSFNGGYGDVFVYKMNDMGSSLIYATYVGGSEDDRGMAIAVNNSGEAYVAGYTFTPPNGFPKTVQFGPTASSSNAFAFKLNSTGSALIYSVYMGANDQEAALDIALNSLGEAIVVGETKSYNFPMAATTYDNTYNGAPYDGFFVKLNASGTAMLSSGFIGGLRDDRVKGVAVDKNNNVYITGYTGSANFPVSAGAYDNSHNGGLDAFVMKFNPGMTTPQYSTYLGGIYDEEGLAIDVNDQAEAVITGYTFSTNYPTTTGTGYKGLKDIILTKMNQTGNGLVYSRYIGGSNNEEGTSLALEANDNVFVVGITKSTNGDMAGSSVLSPKSINESVPHVGLGDIINFEYNVYFGIVCTQGLIKESRIIGGSKDDYNKPSIGIPNKNRVCDLMIGFTSHSDNLPTTYDAYQEYKLNGGVENDQLALFKIMISKDTTMGCCAGLQLYCTPQTITICDFIKDVLFCDSTETRTCQTVLLNNPDISFSESTEITRGCEVVGGILRHKLLTATTGEIIGEDTICKGETTKLTVVLSGETEPGAMVKVLWSTGDTTNFINVNAPGVYWVRVSNICYTDYDTIVIKEIDRPTLNLGPDRTFCFPASTVLVAANANDTIPTTYLWTPGGQTSPFITVAVPDTFCVTKTNQCGAVDDCIIINDSPDPSVDLGKDTSLCNGNPITLDAGNPGATYVWSPGGQTTQTIQVTLPGNYSVTVTNSCGSASDAVNVALVATPPLVNLGLDLLLCSPSDFPHLLDAGNPGSNYYWSNGANTQTISIAAGGQYFVTVTNGCGQDRDTLSVTAPPSLGLELGPDRILCAPASLVLDAGNTGASFLWTPGGQTSQTKTVNTSGTYSVTVSNACGNASDNITLTIEGGLPAISLGPNRSICPGTPTILNVASAVGQTYLWSTGASTSSVSVSIPGIYWVEVTNSCGIVRDSITLLNGMPSFSLGPDRFVCAPTSVNLNVTGAGTSFLWSNGSTASSITISTTAIYWVDVTNTCGTKRDSIFVSVGPGIPNVNLGPDQVQCSSFSTTLDAGNPGATYLWSPGGQTTQTIPVNTGGQYIVTVTNGCGADSDTILITTQPLTALGPDVSICQGTSTLLDAGNPGATYLWTPGGQTTQSISVSTAGNYSVTVTNACGSISDNIDVAVLAAAPSVDLGPDQRVCAPVSIMLDAMNPGATYVWSTGANTQTIQVTTSGTYTVQVNNSCGNDSDVITIVVDAGMPLVNLGPDQSLCNPVFLPLDAGAGAASYTWNTGATTQSIFASSSGTYSVTASNACGSASDNIVVTTFDPVTIALKDTGGCINPVLLEAGNPGANYFWSPGGFTTPTILANVTGIYTLTISNACGIFSKSVNIVINTAVPSFDLGADTNLCTPSGLMLNAGVQQGGNYLWSPGGDTTQTKVAQQAGLYSVTVTNYCGATSDNITIASNPVFINARYQDTICIGASIRLYTDSLPTYAYSWTPASTLENPLTASPLASPSATTEYFVSTSDGTCFNIDSVTIYVEDPIKPDIDIFPPSREGFVPLEIIFKDRNNIGVTYQWDFDDGSISNLVNPTHTFNTENYFDISVIAITENGCKAYDTITIKAFTLYIPNLITPNGDGRNDTWELTRLHDELYVEIYNRWGDRVYKHDHYINEWGGENLSDGVYYYLVEDRKFNKKYKGWVQLLRAE